MKFDVITIGTATRDAFIKSEHFHVDPDHHVLGGKGLVMALGAKIEVPDIFFSTGGGATNAAVTLSRQQKKTACIAVIGNDDSGHSVLNDLKKEGVYTGLMQQEKEGTAFSLLLEPPSGERTVLVHRGVSEHLKSSGIQWQKIDTKWFYISSLAGNIALLKRIIAFSREKGIHIAYNPGGKELKQRAVLVPLLKYIKVLIVNREEASVITGVAFEKQKEMFALWDKMSPGINVMTDARNGVSVSDGTHVYHAGIYKEKKMVDRTGAGDAFGSGFVASIMDYPHDIERAIRLGSANATAKVEGMGAKYGLLTGSEFEKSSRFRRLEINKTPL
ncbi:MAG: carbohydrate kinase family protein [Candidatus Sungbacteria bacterium]|nr:carbohydrate kinase family protein [bacterium]MDZ4260468.1 carbohydrate kinase family protein [Candidatus Sungbacteria bacterium]